METILLLLLEIRLDAATAQRRPEVKYGRAIRINKCRILLKAAFLLSVVILTLLEPSQIEVQLLLAYSSKLASPKPAWDESSEALPTTESSIEGTIHLSKPVKVFIMPKPARR